MGEIAERGLLRSCVSGVLLGSGCKARSNYVLHAFHSRRILVVRHFLVHARRLDPVRYCRCSDVWTSLGCVS